MTFEERDYQAFKLIQYLPSLTGKWSRCVSLIEDFVLTGREPKIYNVSVPLANTEVSQALSDTTKKFTIKLRAGVGSLKFAFTATESASNYITVPPGCSYTDTDLQLSSKTIYFQSTRPTGVVEIIEWS